MNRLVFVCSIAMAWGVASAQTAPAFEVASVKLNTSGDRSASTNANKGEVLIRNTTLKRLVEIAYRVRDYAFNGPDWLDSLRFDIRAKFPENTPRDQYPLMLRTLLEERFKLVAHRETRMMSGYEMVTAKGGLKVQPIAATGETNSNTDRGHFEAKGFSMKDLAELLSRTIDQPVVDKTGIPGVFNFSLDFADDIRQPLTADAPHTDATKPSIFTALQEQLGLRLAGGQKVPVEMVIVDRIERTPTEN